MATVINSFVDRLKSKSVKNSIINNISRDFNLTPILAEAYFNQIKDYFTEHVQLNLTSEPVSLIRKGSLWVCMTLGNKIDNPAKRIIREKEDFIVFLL